MDFFPEPNVAVLLTGFLFMILFSYGVCVAWFRMNRTRALLLCVPFALLLISVLFWMAWVVFALSNPSVI